MTDTIPADAPAPRWLRRLGTGILRVLSWWPVALCAALGVFGGAEYGSQTPLQYSATSYVVVTPGRSTDQMTALGFAHAYGRIVTDPAVLKKAQSAPKTTAEDLKGKVQASTSPDAPMIEITATDRTPDRAAVVANKVTQAFVSHANSFVGNTRVRLSVFVKAVPDTDPTSPSRQISAAVGLSAGGLVGCLILLVRPGKRRGTTPTVPALAVQLLPPMEPDRGAVGQAWTGSANQQGKKAADGQTRELAGEGALGDGAYPSADGAADHSGRTAPPSLIGASPETGWRRRRSRLFPRGRAGVSPPERTEPPVPGARFGGWETGGTNPHRPPGSQQVAP